MEGNILQDGTFDKKASQRILRLYTVEPDKGGAVIPRTMVYGKQARRKAARS